MNKSTTILKEQELPKSHEVVGYMSAATMWQAMQYHSGFKGNICV